jgi:DDE superfamily endonuclease
MDQLIPSLVQLLATLAPAFRKEVFPMFQQMVGAWIVCLGRRTVSRVWETTGQTRRRHHAAAFRLFSQAVWNWDEVIRLLLVAILQTFIPGMRVWVVVDDTLCHKRGAKVAFGGIFLDAVLSTKRHKTFRFGNNWVLLGLVVSLPFRQDRFFCLPLLWRVYEKRGKKSKKEHRTKPQLAAEAVRTLAGWLPGREILVVADSAYIGKALLYDRPDKVDVIGPICWHAALTAVKRGSDGQDVFSDKRLPTPRAILADDRRWPAQTRVFTFPNGRRRRLQIKWVEACWATVAGKRRVAIVLVRDPKGEWRDEALVCTNPDLCDWDIVIGYCRRWSVEVAIGDAKGQMGFHDPCVWKKESVERAAPLAWFTGTLVMLWYAREHQNHKQAQRHRPWYLRTFTTFGDMLSSCRLALWENWRRRRADKCPANKDPQEWLFEYMATAA